MSVPGRVVLDAPAAAPPLWLAAPVRHAAADVIVATAHMCPSGAIAYALDNLPEERAAELDAISRRYERVRVLTFPAAVVHLVPARADR